ncbi:probable cation-transporting ATPase 13A3 isoform X2 [Agrilus planipennis]|nr:probable cation-transporting ATPase 13A3 isoform X2 [Agrilus planipennis]
MEFNSRLRQKRIRLRKQLITLFEDEELEFLGFKKDQLKCYMLWLFCVLTLGFLNLFFYWYPKMKLVCTHKRCFLDEAEKLLLVDIYQKVFKTFTVENIRVLTASSSSHGDNLKKSSEGTQKIRIHLGGGLEKEYDEIKVVWHKKLCYIWDSDEGKFINLHGYDSGIKHCEYYNFKGFSEEEQIFRRIIYDKNEISIPTQSVISLILREILTPFYIFQIFSLIIWFAESYYYYTIAIVIMSAVGITSSVIESKKNQNSLRKTVHSTDRVTVRRANGSLEEIQSNLLVPGDVLVIPEQGGILHCDAILLNGNCVVNESMLTGESVPITKTPVPKDTKCYNIRDDAPHTLFSGTKIIQTRSRNKIFAIVLRTGFQTTKGQLVRTILYPPPTDFKFDQDSYKFIGVLAFIALVGFIYTIVSKSYRGISGADIAVKALDIITIVIPPALPAAMTVGKLYALFRLKKQNIYCTNSSDINVSGSLNCICFDKTGTLTEDGLDMFGVVISDNGSLQDAIKDVRSIPKDEELIKGMVSCHSLSIINGEISGDPLDVKMFESSGWTLYEKDHAQSQYSDVATVHPVAKPPQLHRRVSSISLASNKNLTWECPKEIEIVHQFHFSSKLQMMSVIVKEKSHRNHTLYSKGAPEKIISLCRPETVPKDSHDKLASYTQKGYRVIAMAMKIMDDLDLNDPSELNREDVETNLDFIGFVIFENRLKSETKEIIEVLKDADFKTIMITGDNILTALSVARECGIIEQSQRVIDVSVIHLKETDEYKIIYNDAGFKNDVDVMDSIVVENDDPESGKSRKNYCYSMTGSTWALIRKYFPQEMESIVVSGVVFARMTSDQKQQLVQELKMYGYYVGMCGDGANDVGALKAAHVGISLSEEESSVASPFTSKETNISCVVHIIREGRAALVTSFGVFKFMVCYSLAEFTSVIILYGVDSNLTSLQFLFIDVFLGLQFASVFGKTRAYKGPLCKTPPKSSLLGFTPLMSIILQILLIAIFQTAAFLIIQEFDWFTPFEFDPETPHFFSGFENYAVFCVSTFQYIIIAVVFSKGKPYREPLYTNKLFMMSIVMSTLVCSYITLFPADRLAQEFELIIPPLYNGRITILAISLAHLVTALIAENLCVEILISKKILPRFRRLGSFQGVKTNIYFKPKKAIDEKNIKSLGGCSNRGFVDDA